jgi:aminoglycoside phosphotransferase (APT) family kinase protein
VDTERLGEIVGTSLGARVDIEDLTRLPGGASKETWSFAARRPDGEVRRFVLRTDRAGSFASTMALEAALFGAAERCGVPVPRVVASGDDTDGLERAFLVIDFVDGETIPRRILRDDAFREARAAMAGQCGRILADVHRIPPAEVPGLPTGDPLEQLRRQLAQLGQPHPAFELGLLWLDQTQPPRSAERVVHGDFRNGNLIVGADGIRAVLDWELAHLGDPIEDLGWLCVKAWRFGSPHPVGGFGPIDELVRAYQEAGGGSVDEAELHWWIVFGTLRWGIICIAQTMTHLTGVVRSVELAAIGRRVCEVESDLLELLPWTASGPGAETVEPHESGDPSRESARAGPPHDVPSAAQLLDAVHEFLESDVREATEGRVRFHARVAANVVAMVTRELELGSDQAVAHQRLLRSLGVSSEEELALAIRSGTFDDRLGKVTDAVRSTVADKLAVAKPAYGAPAQPG